jgi:apolipoprotein N-acyltransferase
MVSLPLTTLPSQGCQSLAQHYDCRMNLKTIILIVFGLGLIAFIANCPWIFGAFIFGFAGLIWLAFKLDKIMGIR